jgi:hypothetical protein
MLDMKLLCHRDANLSRQVWCPLAPFSSPAHGRGRVVPATHARKNCILLSDRVHGCRLEAFPQSFQLGDLLLVFPSLAATQPLLHMRRPTSTMALAGSVDDVMAKTLTHLQRLCVS